MRNSSGEIDEVAYLLAIISAQTVVADARLDIDRVMSLVAQRSQEITEAAGAAVELAEDDAMVYRAATGSAAPSLGARIPIAGSLSGLCVQTGDILRCDDSLFDPRVNVELCRRIGVRSMIVVPLPYEDRPVGVLKVLSPHPNWFEERDVRWLQLMAGLVGSAMAHAIEHCAKVNLLAERTEMLNALRVSEARLNEQLELTQRLNADLESANARLATLATTDALTGLRNRRHFDEVLRDGCALMKRRREPVSMILVDVDEFKKYNDTFGHPAGDAVLRRVAANMRDQIRGHEVLARFGGEEFAILLLGAGENEAFSVAERLRAAVAAGPWLERQVTASFGVSTIHPGEGDPAELVARADEALYQSKRSGRNRVTRFTEALVESTVGVESLATA